MDNSPIVDRMKQHLNIHDDKKIADIFSLSPANFSNRKKRGSLLAELTKWGVEQGVDLNWLIKGETEKCTDTVGEKTHVYSAVDVALLREAIEKVMGFLKAEGVPITPRSVSRWAADLYVRYLEASQKNGEEKTVDKQEK